MKLFNKEVIQRYGKRKDNQHKKSVIRIVTIIVTSGLFLQFIMSVYGFGRDKTFAQIAYEQTQITHEMSKTNQTDLVLMNSFLVSNEKQQNELMELMKEHKDDNSKEIDKILVKLKEMQNVIEDELFGGKDIFRGNNDEVDNSNYFRQFDKSGRY